MERLVNEKPSGLSATALRTWGMLFLALGTVGRGILQTGYSDWAVLRIRKCWRRC